MKVQLASCPPKRGKGAGLKAIKFAHLQRAGARCSIRGYRSATAVEGGCELGVSRGKALKQSAAQECTDNWAKQGFRLPGIVPVCTGSIGIVAAKTPLEWLFAK
jgi:hypothetical protein